jgi:hypothetical protein
MTSTWAGIESSDSDDDDIHMNTMARERAGLAIPVGGDAGVSVSVSGSFMPGSVGC